MALTFSRCLAARECVLACKLKRVSRKKGGRGKIIVQSYVYLTREAVKIIYSFDVGQAINHSIKATCCLTQNSSLSPRTRRDFLYKLCTLYQSKLPAKVKVFSYFYEGIFQAETASLGISYSFPYRILHIKPKRPSTELNYLLSIH